ncbi:periplasmic binding protein [Thermoanaerobacter kivui]|uniref:Periplasmic binding protein n=1 Tax=Thermoanaerobacter kivui TaxID=2325 RepID=A0A097APG5_THEKI|nr:stalk domain-containing protein [Thermoanaerobacter kivui]AIS51711.1 periplasmic binding protein [Thermoanaerobacter kivui]
MKKKICFLMIFVLLMSLLPAFGLANPVKAQETQVYLNGVKINMGDALPCIVNGRTMVPVRLFSENLGATVKWDNTTQTVTIQSEDVSVKLIIGKKEAVVNGKNKTLDAAPMVISGRTMVPLRFIAEAFGAVVKWDKEASKAVVVWNVKIKDSTGNDVTVPAGLNRLVVLNTDAAESLRILQIPDEFIVGVSDTVKTDPYLGFENKESVGSWQKPNFEKILSVKPQAVITYGKWPDTTLEDNLKPAGIKVIRLDLYKPETYDNDLKTLAKIFGRVKTAEEFIQWKANKTAVVVDRVKDLKPENKVKVFGIWSSSLTATTWKTFAQNTAVHQGLESAGGINVARDMKDYPEISPEWVLEKNPDKIVIGTYDKDVIGYSVKDNTNVSKLRDSALVNPVISQTNAGKNKEVYIISTKLFGGNKTYLGSLYLAKWLYPDRFKDVNPSQILKEYFEKWLGIPMKGVWAYPEP